MRVARLFFFVSISFVLSTSIAAQQIATPSPQALALLQKSLAALTGGQAITDVTLSGTARRIAGSDDEIGTVVFKALANGSSRLDLSLPSGPRSEIRSASADDPTGTWSGPDGMSHPIAYHNLISEPAWFFSAIVLAQPLGSSGYVATYVGHETRDSAAVEHISMSRLFPSSSRSAAAHQRLSQVEIYLDSSLLVPAAFSFNIHPDDDAGRDIPIEIRFSDYRIVNGAQVPFRIQKFLNNSLTLDLQFSNPVFNSGLSPSTFTVGAGLQPGSGAQP
jgi:hypothetical protein